MLKNLIGAQIVSIHESIMVVRLNNQLHTLELIVDKGECCGFANFTMNLLYKEGDIRNPIITNIETTQKKGAFGCSEILVVTFYGEHKELAKIESEAGSGSGWHYGAAVSLHCTTLGMEEKLVYW